MNVGGFVNIVGQLRGGWTALQENVSLATTASLNFGSNNIRSLKFLIRGVSATTAASLRLQCFRPSGAVFTYDGGTMGASSTTTWPSTAIHLMSLSAGADVATFTIYIDYGGYNGSNQVYNVMGMGYNGSNNVSICGQVYASTLMDNTLFLTSAGSIDAGVVSTYATYY